MKAGKDLIIFPLDVADDAQARSWVEKLHQHVGMFKIGLELFIRSGPDMVRWIRDQTGTGIFLDLKLHDIPVTVERAMRAAADLGVSLATVHCGESKTMLEAAVRGAGGRLSVLGVTVLTSLSGEDLRDAGYRDDLWRDVGKLVLRKAAVAKAAGCAGVVCSGREAGIIKSTFGQTFIAATPGIRPQWEAGRSDDQRRVVTPAMAVADGADYLVIGRPIRDARHPVETARRIAEEIEDAYQKRK